MSGATANDQLGVACSTSLPAGLTPAVLARLYRDAMRDKSYEQSYIGGVVAQYLRHKNRRLSKASQRSYEGSLANLARFYADLEDLQAFNPPLGTAMLEDYLDVHWHHATPGTFNVNLAITRDFFKWAHGMGLVAGNPALAVERARKVKPAREVFSPDDRRALLASNPELRDRLCLRLLLDYALRKGALRGVRFRDFDHHRRRLTIRTKGDKVQQLPIPEPMFWRDLERHVLEIGAQPDHYLLCKRKVIPRAGVRYWPDKPMAETSAHLWFYRCQAAAGITEPGVVSGSRMHKARHTAGQRLLEHTGNIKAVQKFLGHDSFRTTAETYVDWDLDQLTASLESLFDREDDDR